MTSAYSSRYFDWLVDQIAIEQNGERTYHGMFERLHWKEFREMIANDDNRIGDAEELRKEFWGEGAFVPENPVSVLEVIIALSRRCSFQDDAPAEVWAWQLIKNLKLHRMSDPITRAREQQIDDILEALIWRTYEKNGQGGFFPLKNPGDDQTKVEIWYQMSAYILERS